jgi:hypothetical protein
VIVDILTFFVAVLALGVSILSAVSSRNTAKRQNELQEQLLGLERNRDATRTREGRRANVRAAVQNAGGDCRLIVMNEGPATAQNVRVELDSVPLFQHDLAVLGEQEVTLLGSGAYARYLLAPSLGSAPTVHARITWDDDSGEARSWESELTL